MSRAKGERLLGIARKLLHSRDFNGTKDYAIMAQEAEPLLEGLDQIVAVADVLLSSEKRINNHHDWYSILQLKRNSDDELVKKQYRKLALLLHPDKNKFPFADQAFKLVADAWAVLCDSEEKTLYDKGLCVFSRVDLSDAAKLPVRRSRRQIAKKRGAENAERNGNNRGSRNQNREDREQRTELSSFWTACPYCYVLFEYPRVYQNCCLRCQSCRRAFHAALILTMPPLVPGKEAYYCCWAFFPLGFVAGSPESGGKNTGAAAPPPGFPNWMPPLFAEARQQPQQEQAGDKNGGAGGSAARPCTAPRTGSGDGMVEIPDGRVPQPAVVASKKRGRPRKYPLRSPPGFPNWMPPLFAEARQQPQQEQAGDKNGGAGGSAARPCTAPRTGSGDGMVEIPDGRVPRPAVVASKKRGRPRKYPLRSPPGFPNWMPPLFAEARQQPQQEQAGDKNGGAGGSAARPCTAPRTGSGDGMVEIPDGRVPRPAVVASKKRGRPRKCPLRV